MWAYLKMLTVERNSVVSSYITRQTDYRTARLCVIFNDYQSLEIPSTQFTVNIRGT